jgi:hypothetical protein
MRRRSTAGAICVSLFSRLLARHVRNGVDDRGEVTGVTGIKMGMGTL